MFEIGQNISQNDIVAARPRSAYFGEVIYEPGGALGPRVQPDIQAVMVDRGSAQVAVDGPSHRVGVGQVICLWPGGHERFGFDPRVATTHRWVALSLRDPDRFRARLDAAGLRSPVLLTETKSQRAIFRAGRAVQSGAEARSDPVRVHLALAYLQSALATGSRGGETAHATPPHPAIAAALKTIERGFDKPLTLDDLAEAASVTPSHLVRLFRKHLGTTPMRSLWDARVNRGAELLRETGLSVSEIAYRVGFANPYHYSRLTRKQLGLSPLAWRKRAWSGGR